MYIRLFIPEFPYDKYQQGVNNINIEQRFAFQTNCYRPLNYAYL